ncbi:MAG: hypothetical protein ABI823_08295 [Bryobacteraceae bacterium]
MPAYVGLAVLLIAGFVYGYVRYVNETAPKPLELTPEAKAYITHLKLADVTMQAYESYVGARVVEITGKIANDGPRAISSVVVTCVFYDGLSQVVLRQKVPIVSARTGGLKPQEAKPFRLPFDGLSDNWNRQMPQLVIASIEFS